MAYDALSKVAKEKGTESWKNLAPTLDRESTVLVDPAWDERELADWLAKVSEDAENKALCFNFEKLSASPPAVPEFHVKPTVSKLEERCIDLSKLIIDEAKGVATLSKEFTEIPTEYFNVEDYVSFSPEAQPVVESQEP